MSISTVDFYLPNNLIQQVEGGQHKFFSQAKSAFEGAGLKVQLCEDSKTARLRSADIGNYCLFYMQDPFHDLALDVRKAYLGHFWKIEKTTHRELHYISQKPYKADWINENRAKRFFDRWHDIVVPDKILKPANTGYVFIPLQGKLLEERSFQLMSPIDMIVTTLKHEKYRDVYMKLHPGELYSKAEMAAVNTILKNPRVKLVKDDMFTLIAGCDYIVSENSSVCLKAFFLQKPSILFAWIDFHHMCQNAMAKNIEDCFKDILTEEYDYKKYVFWFLQKHSLNMWRDDAQSRILERCKELGWDI